MEARQWWPTATQIAASIREALDEGRDVQANRILMDGINYLPDAHKAGDLDNTLVEPPSIGDIRWDTLLAASIQYRLNSIGATSPAWTCKEPLAQVWQPWPMNLGPHYSEAAQTPAELLTVNIVMDRRSFTSA